VAARQRKPLDDVADTTAFAQLYCVRLQHASSILREVLRPGILTIA
jgi:hypothetical protein